MGQNICTSCLNRPAENGEIKLEQSSSTPLISPNAAAGVNVVETQRKLNEALDTFKELLEEGIDGTDCEVIVDESFCKVSAKELEKGYVIKYKFFMQHSREEFFDFMAHTENRHTWDKNVKFSKRLAEFEGIGIIHTVYKGQMGASAREAVVATKKHEYGKGVIDFSTSVETEEVPENGDHVRVAVHTGGYYVEPIPTDEQGNITMVMGVSYVDLKIPKYLEKMAKKFSCKTMPTFAKNLVKALDKHKNK